MKEILKGNVHALNDVNVSEIPCNMNTVDSILNILDRCTLNENGIFKLQYLTLNKIINYRILLRLARHTGLQGFRCESV